MKKLGRKWKESVKIIEKLNKERIKERKKQNE